MVTALIAASVSGHWQLLIQLSIKVSASSRSYIEQRSTIVGNGIVANDSASSARLL